MSTAADGLLMAPTYAVPRLLARNRLSLQDFDFYETHEAFASVVLARLQVRESEDYCKERLGLDAALGSIDLSKLDATARRARRVTRSPRPVAASWCSWPKPVADKKKESGGRTVRGLISICAAGAQGVGHPRSVTENLSGKFVTPPHGWTMHM